MSHDQAARGYEDDEPSSTGWLLILGAAILAALVSLVSHHTKSTTSPTPPAPSAFPAPSPSASASATPSASVTPSNLPASPADPTAAVLAQIGGYVSVGQVCAPITDGKTTLTVRFLLENATALPEQLLSVTPELPMNGLKPRGSAVQKGTCAHPLGKPAKPARNPMPQGGTLIVSLKFALPNSCPAPYPVQAVVKVGIGGVQRLDSVALYSDLGSVKFALCKGTG